jgi:sugar phosphate isomerase/epimerase
MRLGISSYTFVWAAGVPGYESPRTPLTRHQLLQIALGLGVHVVQIADNMPLDRLSATEVNRLAAHARELNLSLEAGTCGFEPDHLQRYLELAVRLSSPILRVVMDSRDHHITPDQAVPTLKKILPAFEQANVVLAIENHDRLRAKQLAEIIERANSTALGICLDTANSLGCGEDVFTVLHTLAPWIVNVHIKDFIAVRLPHKKGFTIEGCPAGQGALDLPTLFAELHHLPHDPNIILELWPPPENNLDATIAKESAWTQQSIGELRKYIPD